MSTSASPNHVCYVHCNFCNTILVVCVPGTNCCSIMTVRCGHCSNLLSVNMGGHLHSLPGLQDLQKLQGHNNRSEGLHLDSESSSRCNRIPLFNATGSNQQDVTPTHTSEKRQRAPSAYNRFIKEEIRRLKTTNPDISHREAFSAAAKNIQHLFLELGKQSSSTFYLEKIHPLKYSLMRWAHYPYIQFGLNHDANKQVKIDDPITTQEGQESQSYY